MYREDADANSVSTRDSEHSTFQLGKRSATARACIERMPDSFSVHNAVGNMNLFSEVR